MHSTSNKKKILIIFPRFSQNEASHYPYWYQLFSQAAKQLDIALIFESGDRNATLPNITNISVQHLPIKPLNLIERFLLIVKYLIKGYRSIYVHYSYFSVFLLRILKLIFPIKIYYWNCEKYPGKPYDNLLKLVLDSSDVLVTGHKSLIQSYKSVFNFDKPIKIVPNWVHQNYETKVILDPSKTHILFAHHLSPRKGTRQLVSMIKKTISSDPKTFFHIVGDGPDKNWIISNLQEQKPFLKIYGSLSQHKLHSLIKSVDYFIMPSLTEGFPRVILEAMIAKTLFVSTDVGCVKHIVSKEQQQFLTKPNNTNQFVKCLHKLMTYKQKNQLRSANFSQAKTYNLSTASNAFIKLFDHD